MGFISPSYSNLSVKTSITPWPQPFVDRAYIEHKLPFGESVESERVTRHHRNTDIRKNLSSKLGLVSFDFNVVVWQGEAL